MAKVEVDATLLSRGMMFRRRKRNKDPQTVKSQGSICTEDQEDLLKKELAEQADLLEFTEYVGRDLQFDVEPPLTGRLPSAACGANPGRPQARAALQRRDSYLFEHDAELMNAVERLGKLGDSIDGQVCAEMREAIKAFSEDGDIDPRELDYDEYKKAAAPFLNSGKEGWLSVAKLFRFGDEILTVQESCGLDGEVDPALEQKLEDYNSRVLVDLASAFLSRAGGLVGLLA